MSTGDAMENKDTALNYNLLSVLMASTPKIGPIANNK
jgi:hypothetical protein